MAIKNFVGNNAGMPLGFNRGNPIPLDSSSIWATFEEAQEYAKNGAVAYVGQVIAVNYDEGAKAYIIADEAGTLVEVGSGTEITEADILDALGFDEAENGAQLVKGSDGSVSWVVPSTDTVEGLQTSISTLQADVNKLNGTAETEGSVAYQIAAIVNGADDSYDTLKEIADWIKSDATGAAAMSNDISVLKEKVGETSVADAINAALKDGETDKYALASSLIETDTKVADNTSDITAIYALLGKTESDEAVSVADAISAALGTGEDAKFADKTHSHAVADITGLQDILNGKAKSADLTALGDKVSALENKANKDVIDAITQDDVTKWNSAEENVLEAIKIGEENLPIVNKIATLPLISDSAFGVGKVDNTSISADNGVIGVKAVHISKIYMDDEDELILNGGNASVTKGE